MLYLIVVTLGVTGFRYLPVDLLPPIEFPQLTIAIEYSNVGPEELERIVTEPIENAVAGVNQLERVNSFSREGLARIRLRFAQGANLDEAANDVRAALDLIRDSLPDEMEPPRLYKFDPNEFPIITLSTRSTHSLPDLTSLLENELANQFEQIAGVGAVEVWGGVYREMQVDLKRNALLATATGPEQVVEAIGRDNTNLPAGNLRSGIGDLYVRTLGEYRSVDDVKDTIVRYSNDAPVRVGDLAQVQLGYRDIDRYIEIDNVPSVLMDIRKQVGGNTVAIAERVRNAVSRINATRDDLKITVVVDESEYIQNSIKNVRNSAIWGGVLALIVLMAFLRNGSVTMITAITIPVSIIATFALLYFGGLTLNQMSFGGLALGVGLIVDNAIVVLENIVRKRQQGNDAITSAQDGTREVAGAILASTLTTTVIFLPVLFMRTVTGSLFQELALVVTFALFCSLVVSLTLVPMLSAKMLGPTVVATQTPQWFELLRTRYEQLIEQAMHWRAGIVVCTVLLLAACLALLPKIPWELTPQTDGGEIQIRMQLDDGANIAVLHHHMQALAGHVDKLIPYADVRHVTHDLRADRAVIRLHMKPASERKVDSKALADTIRNEVQNAIPGAEMRIAARSGLSVLRRTFGGGTGEEGLELQLRGENLAVGQALSQELISTLEQIPGISDVDASTQQAQPQLNLLFDRDLLAHLGSNPNALAQALQTSVGGRRAGIYRIGAEEVPITVRYQPQDRFHSDDLGWVALRTAAGAVVPADTVIRQQRTTGPHQIDRVDGQRVIYINANLLQNMTLGEAINDIQRTLLDFPMPPGFSLYFGGEYEEQQKAQADFLMAIIMALILVYMVMAAQFERLLDPLIVMLSVPLIAIGVIPTLLLTNTTLNIQSLMGVVMLIGIVVNNAIVLVDYINMLRRKHSMPVEDAIRQACALRLRPILMTSSTTLLALLPLSFGFGDGAEFQAALARVVVGGLLASTLITLVLIPVVYSLSYEWQQKIYARHALVSRL